jgi:hypothetical protein
VDDYITELDGIMKVVMLDFDLAWILGLLLLLLLLLRLRTYV